ncbi:unnamed protein product [Chondrus crispus]|uniref:Uncharacterized protein n=1 Tax=Chondrus crispus TaxID=2769 RepID=R7QCP9_CHOCR|nr:unnamed protein product [Chondrus crispus]CDF35235.1 unnamed protein product [Chondrus crispus]|eukprot:XP_005715054.1 unnamed protein product [Chondrus crispus]
MCRGTVQPLLRYEGTCCVTRVTGASCVHRAACQNCNTYCRNARRAIDITSFFEIISADHARHAFFLSYHRFAEG